MPRKINKNIMESNDSPRNTFDEYTNRRNYRKVPVNSVIIDKMAQEFTDYCSDNDEVLSMEDIYNHFGLYVGEFTNLKNKYPKLKLAYEQCRQILGARRFNKAANFKLNWAVIASTQSRYSPDAVEQAEFLAALKMQNDQNHVDQRALAQMIAEALKPSPTSVLVPEKGLK
jgi:hypothetical protein